MWIAGSGFSWYDVLIIISSNYCWNWRFAYFVEYKTFTNIVPVCPFNSVVPKLFWTVTQIKVAAMSLLPSIKFFLHFLSKISIAVIARNTEQQYGFSSALPPKESHITPGG